MTSNHNNKAAVRSDFLRSPQGPLFLAGCLMVLLWIAAAACLWQLSSPLWGDILTVGFAHLLAGRAISIAQGTQVGLPQWLIVFVATYADVTAMFIFYPLFVYSYEHFLEGHFFQKRMKPMLESAEKNVSRIGPFKAVGVFFFVWLPFWMTGIIVGAILGYLLGLRTWVTITTVILGAFAAVASWVYAYDVLFKWLATFHQEIPLLFTIGLIIGLVLFRMIRRRKNARN
jgi:uncharacterized membrane protein